MSNLINAYLLLSCALMMFSAMVWNKEGAANASVRTFLVLSALLGASLLAKRVVLQ